MAELRDILFYLVGHSPHRSALSNARVTKMVYLADWRSAITRGHQLSNIRWYFDHYGPFVNDVMLEIERNPDLFAVELTHTEFGNPKREIRLRDAQYVPQLSADERAVIDHVIEKTHVLSFDGFIRLVYSTFPVLKSERYTALDLPALAAEYSAQGGAGVGV